MATGGEGMSSPLGSRNMRLGAGRRVRVRDLLNAGLVSVGDELLFDRPRSGEKHRAYVTESGAVRLEDGQEFGTPSRAAGAVAGISAIDGWTAWSTVSGESLDVLRQRYLDLAATSHSDALRGDHLGAAAVGSAQDTPYRLVVPHEFLKEARSRAFGDNPLVLPVKELISRWGADSRTTVVDAFIADDLANHGLMTHPDFRTVRIDHGVRLLSTARLLEVTPDTSSNPAVEDAGRRQPGLTLGNLPSALGGVESVTPQSSFDEAVTKMLLNDYSQLAVLNGRDLRGAVTWRSIAQARHLDPDAPLSRAITPTEPVSYATELLDVLPLLFQRDFVFVRGPQNKIDGIVTAADVVNSYGDIATPFMLVGEIDVLLRQAIADAIPFEDAIKMCDPNKTDKIRGFDDLSMGDYKRILESRDNWLRLDWPMDRGVFIGRLEEIRNYRNDIMHFSPDPLPPKAIGKLRSFIMFLRQFVG